MKNIKTIFVSPQSTLHEVLVQINAGASGIALVVDEEERLLGVITDGDARRAILRDNNLSITAQDVLDTKKTGRPLTAKVGTHRRDLIELFKKTRVSHIPIVNDRDQVVDMIRLSDLLACEDITLNAVVMAGGLGKRLHPLTKDIPKPMLRVGNRPLLERIIGQLRQTGIKRVHITTHYLADKIMDHFGNGSDLDMELEYVSETNQMGTAGGLASLPEQNAPLLVINGDILTDMDFRAMLDFHQEHQADMTLAVRQYETQVPYGVIEKIGPFVTKLVEKPKQNYFVNAGIYLLEPETLKLIPKDTHFDMTDMLQALLEAGYSVVGFPVFEYWRDIGQISDYEEAQDDMKNGKVES